MNISSEICPTHGFNFFHYFFFNVTEVEIGFATLPVVEMITVLLGFPINSYVIWLIVTGTGNGLAAEFFSLNLAVSEIIFCIESLLAFFSSTCQILSIAVYFLDGQAITGRPLFQCLIYFERYLAVVHPVTFLKFKPLRYRVICSVIVWVAGFISSVINIIFILFSFTDLNFILILAQFCLFLFIQLFCLVAVLRALKQSGPGERGRERNRENHMKRRAFFLILIIAVTMFLFYVPYVIFLAPQWISADNNAILLSISYSCFTLAGLVQPLLFLYRVRKLPFMKYFFSVSYCIHHY